MNKRITRRAGRAMTPALELLEGRQLLTVSAFSVVPSPQVPNGTLTATAAIANTDIWAVGYDDVQTAPPAFNSPLAEHFNGKSWSVVPTPTLSSGGVNPPNAQFFGVAGVPNKVAGVPSNDVWAVGVKTGPLNPDFGLQLIEHWNGEAWSEVTSPEVEGAALHAVVAISANNVWAVGGGGGSGALVEHWDGTSWSIVTNSVLSSASGVSAVSADSASDIWAVGGETILHFNGTTWSQLASPIMQANSVTALSPTNVWAVGSVAVFANHRMHHKPAIEHWDGTSWSIVSSPNPNTVPTKDTFLRGIAAISANDIWAVGAGNFSTTSGTATLIEHWDGTSWTIVNSPDPGTATNALYAVTALSDGTVVAVGTQENNNTGVPTPLIVQN